MIIILLSVLLHCQPSIRKMAYQAITKKLFECILLHLPTDMHCCVAISHSSKPLKQIP